MATLVPINVGLLFDHVLTETAKRAGPKFDGQRWWQMVFKCVLEEFDAVATTWTKTETRVQLATNVWPILSNIPEEYILAGGQRVMAKDVHFLAQLCRLPQGLLTLRKLCQMALNAAQLGPLIDDFRLKDWRVYCWTKMLYSELCKLESYADNTTLELFSVTLSASGCHTATVMAKIQENIRIFDSEI